MVSSKHRLVDLERMMDTHRKAVQDNEKGLELFVDIDGVTSNLDEKERRKVEKRSRARLDAGFITEIEFKIVD